MNFHFPRQPVPSLVVQAPGPSEGAQPFSAMPQKSISIYSLFGPQATKVNNTVTSSGTGEHGHKTALPLQGSLTQLFICSASADGAGARRGQTL